MRSTRGVEDVLGLVLIVIALVFAGDPAALHAQTTSASVSGSVQDAQGGVLPGVTVTLTSRTQGNVLTTVTDDRVVASCSRSSALIPTRCRPRFRASRRSSGPM